MKWWRRVRDDLRCSEAPTRRDELVFLMATAVVILVLAQLSDPGRAWELALLGVAGAAFVVRGAWSRMPSELFAFAVVLPVSLAIAPRGNLEIGFFLVVVMVLYASWHMGSTTRALLIVAASAATPIAVSASLDGDIAWTPWASAMVFTFVLGRNARRQRLLIEELEATRQALADTAVAEERRRIARELHDLAGHTLAAIVLHVTGARHVLRRDLDEADRALLDAERVGRDSLDQIRNAVAALRTTEHGTDAPLATGHDLAELVEEYRRAGLVIDARLVPPGCEISGPVGTALHRIARESLANVARHASANRVELTVERIGGNGSAVDPAVRLLVSDHGHRPTGGRAELEHFGLIGMRERARGLGGKLSAGPSPDGWIVEATLPISDSTAQLLDNGGDP